MKQEVNFLKICQKCGEYCCRIGGPILSKKEKDRILKVGYKNNFKKRRNFYIIKTRKDGSCLYLENHLCTIYNKRPILCRTWPVVVIIEERKRKYLIGENCLLVKHLTEKDINKAKRELRGLSGEHIKEMFKWSDECGYKAKRLR